MQRLSMWVILGCACLSTDAFAGYGGAWVFEYLLCMDTASASGVPRADARAECGELLEVQGILPGSDLEAPEGEPLEFQPEREEPGVRSQYNRSQYNR